MAPHLEAGLGWQRWRRRGGKVCARLRGCAPWPEYRALDEERVLVLMHFSGRGKTSGLKIEDIQMKGANLFHLRDGKVTRLVTYWDRERAFADVGLEE